MSSIGLLSEVIASKIPFNLDSIRSQTIGSRFENLRPLSEFFDFKLISKPSGFGEAQSRVNYNLGYYSTNYLVIFVLLGLYSLLTNLALLFVIILVIGGFWGIKKLETHGYTGVPISQLYTFLIVFAVLFGFFASPFSTILWLLGASGVTILGHAAFMDKRIEEAFSGDAV